MKPATKIFKFTIEVEAIPYSKDTVKYLFGEDAEYIPDYSEDTIARDTIFDLVKAAICSAIDSKINFLVSIRKDEKDIDTINKERLYYFDKVIEQYKAIEKTIKPTTEGS